MRTYLSGKSTNLEGFSINSGSCASISLISADFVDSFLMMSVIGFLRSSAVGVDTGCIAAGRFSLSSGMKSGFLRGESSNLRFCRFEAVCSRVLEEFLEMYKFCKQ